MAFVVVWLGLAIAAGVVASSKGRSGFGYFILGLLLPLIGVVIAIGVSSVKPVAVAIGDQELSRETERRGPTKWCVACAEEIQQAAKLCRYCGTAQPESSSSPKPAPDDMREHLVFPDPAVDALIEQKRQAETTASGKWYGLIIVFAVLAMALFGCAYAGTWPYSVLMAATALAIAGLIVIRRRREFAGVYLLFLIVAVAPIAVISLHVAKGSPFAEFGALKAEISGEAEMERQAVELAREAEAQQRQKESEAREAAELQALKKTNLDEYLKRLRTVDTARWEAELKVMRPKDYAAFKAKQALDAKQKPESSSKSASSSSPQPGPATTSMGRCSEMLGAMYIAGVDLEQAFGLRDTTLGRLEWCRAHLDQFQGK